MEKKQKKLVLSDGQEIRTKEIAEFTQKYCEEHSSLIDSLADGVKRKDEE